MASPADPPASGAFPDPLALLAELSEDFAESRDLDRTIGRALDLITRQIGAEGGSLFLLEPGGEELTCRASVGPARITGMRIPSSEGVVGRSVRENACQLVRNVAEDPDFTGAIDQQSGFVTHSILCAPLSAGHDPIGAISLVNKTGTDARFGEHDRLLLRTLASSVALAIQNARLTEDLVEQERVQRELELAAEIQRSLLPAPPEGSFPVVGANVPARQVSGDFYDFFAVPDGRIAFAVGDVAGKGINAALLMAKTASLFRALGKREPDPGRLLHMLNDELCETATRGMFVTMAAGLLDPTTGEVRIANAGHEPPLLRDARGGWSAVPAAAPPLGIVPNAGPDGGLPETRLDLGKGALYLFTDGITEARTAAGDELSVAGLRKLIEASLDAAPARRLEAVLAEVRALQVRDDLTLLIVDATTATGADRAATSLRIEFLARATELRSVRERVLETAVELGASEATAQELVLAVDEACQNVIRHAYRHDSDGEVVLELGREGKHLVVTLRDFAAPLDPDRVRPRERDALRPGGLGAHIMREVMDSVEFLPPPSGPGNLLRMRKRIDETTRKLTK